MPEPPNPAPPDTGIARKGEHRDTVLLSDPVGVAAQGSNPPKDSSAERNAGNSVLITNISPAALAALGQRYDILAEAGHGSMGNVYKARDRETGEIVALKLLKPEIASDQAMMDRFKNELLFARKITHKNVCRVYDFNRIAGVAYTSMEFVNGESLRSVLTRFGGLPTRKALDIAQQICSGLKEAHAQGIVHRDLKPENVMIDAQGNVKIMDFGIARSMDVATRLTGAMVGTPAYMAPEQVAGKAVDYRTDIYSLGLVLYEVFTGAPAFQADTAVAVALKQMNEAPPPPHTIDPAFPAPIERAILRCLEKEPAKRFSSIAELSQALGPAPSGLPNPRTVPAMTPNPIGRSSAAPAPATHGSNAPSAPVTNPFYSPAALPPPRRSSSPLGWILLGGLLVVGVLGAQRWAAKAKLAELIEPPSLPQALTPVPPDFATKSTGENSSAPTSGAGDSAAMPSSAAGAASPASNAASQPQPDGQAAAAPASASGGATPAANAGDSTATNLAASKSAKAQTQGSPPTANAPAAAGGVPSDVQKRAERAFKENSDSVAAFHAGSYLWVGRYERKERAESAAKKIEELGLPALVVPRHGLIQDYFIVLSGPYDTARISSVSQWLEDQGFNQVHEFKWPPVKQNTNP
ncbi:MAG TPA: protein kinase [Verrucomicrobiae bacterium]|nr:protein kinase [Verrucomicrobiae bacterium]